ncbi:MAG: hypothetical protein Q9199_004124 [Rusavskia elegans]
MSFRSDIVVLRNYVINVAHVLERCPRTRTAVFGSTCKSGIDLWPTIFTGGLCSLVAVEIQNSSASSALRTQAINYLTGSPSLVWHNKCAGCSCLTVAALAGHARSFFRDSQALLTNARKYFDDSREPFTITIAGAELYIITNPQDMSLVYKSTGSLAFDEFIRDLHVGFGMSAYGRHTMWDDSAGKYLVHQANDLHRAQLHPGEHLDDLTRKLLGQIERRLRPGMVFPGKGSGNRGASKQARLSLYDLCSDVLVPAASVALFGEALLRTSSTFVEDFHAFDEDSWMLTYQYPRLLARKMHQAKERNTDALTRYFQLPLEDRPWTNANVFNICFWLLSYMLHRPETLEKVEEETQGCLLDSGVDIDKLLKCTLLNSSFNEILRLTSGASSARTVVSPTQLRGKILRENRKLLMPYRQLHFEEKVFGPQVKEYRPERFLGDNKPENGPYFKPFGGGITYCSGRFIARREVLAFVALILHRYDIRLADANPVLPRLDEQTPTLGVLGPVKGDCTAVLITPRDVL